MPYHFSQIQALGTTLFLDIEKSTEKEGKHLSKEIFSEAERIEQKYSRFLETSLLFQMNKQLFHWHPVDEEMWSLFLFAQKMQHQTNGFFDISIQSVLESWGYDAEYSLQEKAEKGNTGTIETDTKTKRVKINAPVDFGGFGKGFFLDREKDILTRRDCTDFLINAGGDLFAQGKDKKAEPWTLYFEDPRNTKRAIGKMDINGLFCCSSSPLQRKWRDRHHLVNPKTCTPADEMAAVYVQSNISGMECDALSTALFTMGWEKATQYIEKNPAQAQAMLISEKGDVWKSQNFIGELFLHS